MSLTLKKKDNLKNKSFSTLDVLESMKSSDLIDIPKIELKTQQEIRHQIGGYKFLLGALAIATYISLMFFDTSSLQFIFGISLFVIGNIIGIILILLKEYRLENALPRLSKQEQLIYKLQNSEYVAQFKVNFIGEGKDTIISLGKYHKKRNKRYDEIARIEEEILEERIFTGSSDKTLEDILEYKEELKEKAKEYNQKTREGYIKEQIEIIEASEMRKEISK